MASSLSLESEESLRISAVENGYIVRDSSGKQYVFETMTDMLAAIKKACKDSEKE